MRLAALSATVLVASSDAFADDEITRDIILNDPETPTGGNPNGDLTIVDFFDYNCPYCKAAAKNLEKVVKDDGRIRLVYKDWPILHPTSIIGARLALGEISAQIPPGASRPDGHPGLRSRPGEDD
ncbi:DsbA family protein [Bradyrhizobium elkanii]|uniref:DsbA family protein n=1 Tax=Bradyrhizobium elkanii TaxID=29448 RepID=UPI000402EE70|nr:thioredoxin domain-containing protein [Bradyrhizobium elkanii]